MGKFYSGWQYFYLCSFNLNSQEILTRQFLIVKKKTNQFCWTLTIFNWLCQHSSTVPNENIILNCIAEHQFLTKNHFSCIPFDWFLFALLSISFAIFGLNIFHFINSDLMNHLNFIQEFHSHTKSIPFIIVYARKLSRILFKLKNKLDTFNIIKMPWHFVYSGNAMKNDANNYEMQFMESCSRCNQYDWALN